MIHLCSLIYTVCFFFQAGCHFAHRHKADHPKWKGLPRIFTSEEFDMECCLVWSCCLCCLFLSLLCTDFTKDDLRQQTKRRLYLTRWVSVCVCVIIQSSQGLFHLRQAWYDKGLCLQKPRAFHNKALLNVVAVSQSPWHCTGSLTETFVGQNLIFSRAKNRICLVFFFICSPLKAGLWGILQGFSSPTQQTSELTCCM